ncbi:hypothetical protein VTK56DRAFT_6858 [Thermocarpiscus australiensis]
MITKTSPYLGIIRRYLPWQRLTCAQSNIMGTVFIITTLGRLGAPSLASSTEAREARLVTHHGIGLSV